jgi:hypothetical protein
VENFVKHAWPRLADALAACLVGLIRVKYVFGAEEAREGMRAEDEAAGARGRLRHELRGLESGRTGRFLGGVVQAWYLASPVEAEEAIDATFGSGNALAKRTMRWAGNRASMRAKRRKGVTDDADVGEPNASVDAPLTFAQKCTKHFFEDMRLMYVATTSALLKTLRCTPVGDRDLVQVLDGERLVRGDRERALRGPGADVLGRRARQARAVLRGDARAVRARVPAGDAARPERLQKPGETKRVAP